MSKRYKATEREQSIETVRTSGEPVKVVAKRMGGEGVDGVLLDEESPGGDARVRAGCPDGGAGEGFDERRQAAK